MCSRSDVWLIQGQNTVVVNLVNQAPSTYGMLCKSFSECILLWCTCLQQHTCIGPIVLSRSACPDSPASVPSHPCLTLKHSPPLLFTTPRTNVYGSLQQHEQHALMVDKVRPTYKVKSPVRSVARSMLCRNSLETAPNKPRSATFTSCAVAFTQPRLQVPVAVATMGGAPSRSNSSKTSAAAAATRSNKPCVFCSLREETPERLLYQVCAVLATAAATIKLHLRSAPPPTPAHYPRTTDPKPKLAPPFPAPPHKNQDDELFAFNDRSPAARLHILVCPRAHIPNTRSLHGAASADLVRRLRAVGERLLLERAAGLPPVDEASSSLSSRCCSWCCGSRHSRSKHSTRSALLRAEGGSGGGGQTDDAGSSTSRGHQPSLLFGFHKPPWRSVDHLHMHCFLLPLKRSVAWKYRWDLNWVTAERLEERLRGGGGEQ